MHPILAHFGSLTLYSFGVALACAFLGGTWLAQWTMLRAKARGARVTLSPAQVGDFVFWLLLGGILGARLLYLAVNWEHYRAAPWEVFAIWRGGLIFYGGLAAAAAAGWWYLRRHRVPVPQILDLFTPALALGQSIGRVGCFLNGCCYGKPTQAWWGVRFLWSEAPRHPTQLLESAVTLALAVIFSAWLFRRRPWERPTHGRVILTYLLVYAAWRFGVEFLREDNPMIALGLNFPQWVSLALIAASGALLQRRLPHDHARPHLPRR